MYSVWIGNRESEIISYNIFNESITFYGSNTNGNHAFSTTHRIPNSYSVEFTNYVAKYIIDILDKHPNAKFHFYNPMFAYRISKKFPRLYESFVNINEYETLKWITSKTFVRQWLSHSVQVPSYALLSKEECKINLLKKMFRGKEQFIIQKDISGGGEGTFLFTSTSERDVLSQLKNTNLYLVSPYYFPKKSVCCHMLIGNNDIAILPFGLQQSEICDNKILYRGTGYPTELGLNAHIINKLLEIAKVTGERLRGLGYRGICGLDFIVYDDTVLFIEINARYLGSTFLINKALKEQNLPSVFELNTNCFNDDALPANILRNLNIGYNSFTLKSDSFLDKNNIRDVIKTIESKNTTKIYWDGLESTDSVLPNSYLYRGIY